MKLLQV
jgi:hypothetical protein